MDTGKTILFIAELGGYPLFVDEFQRAGYQVVVERSMRKALSKLKTLKADIVVTEFNIVTQFRDRVSNIESLLARLQSALPDARVIALLEREHAVYLERLRGQFPIFDALYYPLEKQQLFDAIARAAAE